MLGIVVQFLGPSASCGTIARLTYVSSEQNVTVSQGSESKNGSFLHIFAIFASFRAF